MVSKQTAQIKDVLERLYRKYNHHSLIKPDPLQFVYRYRRKADMALAGILDTTITNASVIKII